MSSISLADRTTDDNLQAARVEQPPSPPERMRPGFAHRGEAVVALRLYKGEPPPRARYAVSPGASPRVRGNPHAAPLGSHSSRCPWARGNHSDATRHPVRVRGDAAPCEQVSVARLDRVKAARCRRDADPLLVRRRFFLNDNDEEAHTRLRFADVRSW